MGSSLMMKSLKNPKAEWTVIEPSQDYEIAVLDVINDTLYIYTNYGAPRYRIMTASVKAPQRENWKELVPEQKGVLTGVDFAGDKIILTYDIDAANKSYLYSRDGKLLSEIKFPSVGSAGFSSSKKHDEVFYTFTSFIYPSEIYRYDMSSGDSKLFKATAIEGFNSL